MNYLNNTITFEDYNGWSNRDTWLVMLWLDNDQQNYYKIQNKKNGVGTSTKIADMDNLNLYNYLRVGFNYGDKIDFKKVNIDEIRTALLEN